MRWRLRIFMYLLLCSFLLLSCAAKPEQRLIGKWQEATGKETIEFLKDRSFQGVMLWDLNKTLVNTTGTYAVEGDTVNLRLDKPGNLAPMTLKFKFSGSNNELTITFQRGGALKLDGSTSTYRRVG